MEIVTVETPMGLMYVVMRHPDNGTDRIVKFVSTSEEAAKDFLWRYQRSDQIWSALISYQGY